MDNRREYIMTHDREVILLRERYERAGKELLLYGAGVIVCVVFVVGWLKLYWANFFLNVVMMGGPWCIAMVVVNLIRRINLKRRIEKLIKERSK